MSAGWWWCKCLRRTKYKKIIQFLSLELTCAALVGEQVFTPLIKGGKFKERQADRGFATRWGSLFFWGGKGAGVFAKKMSLRGLRISEKKSSASWHTYIRTYLSTLSTKDFAKINKLTMVMPFAGSYGMTMLFLAPPRCNLFAMDFSRALSKDLIELCKSA